MSGARQSKSETRESSSSSSAKRAISHNQRQNGIKATLCVRRNGKIGEDDDVDDVKLGCAHKMFECIVVVCGCGTVLVCSLYIFRVIRFTTFRLTSTSPSPAPRYANARMNANQRMLCGPPRYVCMNVGGGGGGALVEIHERCHHEAQISRGDMSTLSAPARAFYGL